MKKIGITGKSGFIGSHLANTLKLRKENYEVLDFEDHFFSENDLLDEFVKKSNVIVHLAALNRHNDPQEIYNTNILLVNKLINSLNRTGSKAHVLFSSSTQEEKKNPYGDSKKEGRRLLESWAGKTGNRFTGLIIPNVFGPFGNPFYNSFISTFSYQLCRSQEPIIEVDAEVSLIYIDELITEIIRIIDDDMINDGSIQLQATGRYKVSEVLNILGEFRDEYLLNGVIPLLGSRFRINLFNTFRSYIDMTKHFPFHCKTYGDDRGYFVEAVKLKTGGQVSYSTTKPGITRGNHFHTRKIERFMVIEGEAVIRMRKTGSNEILEFNVSGNEPSFVDMPIWYTHNITNTGGKELITLFWINELFASDNPDTYFEVV